MTVASCWSEQLVMFPLLVMVLTLQVTALTLLQSDLPGRVCTGDKDVRNSPTQLTRKLEGCKVVEGRLHIVLMENSTAQDFESLSFPELREVSSYMLVWKVHGLESLGKLFPNLTVIRGHELMAERFALIVHDVPDLRELGLSSLQSIYNGVARVTENPELCFADTIDWTMISSDNEQDHNVSWNKDPRLCPACSCEGRGCWGPQHRCQEPPKPLLARGSSTALCDAHCAIGCWSPRPQDCFACRQQEFGQQCLEVCPNGTLSLLGRRCVTEAECRSFKYLVCGSSCVEPCPEAYHLVKRATSCRCEACKGPCERCYGVAIRTVADARILHGCKVVKGTIEIIISHGVDVEEELEHSLGKVQEIWGSLIVSRSRPLSSLHFLRSLRIIKGQNAERGQSLFVNENDNLQYLFDWGESSRESPLIVTSPNNKTNVTFYYNPRLCPQEIKKFKEVTNLTNMIDQYNGFINPCGISNGSSRVALRGPGFVKLSWEAWTSSEVIGYAVYLTEAKRQNIIEYSETNPCNVGTASWAVHDVQFERGVTEVSQFLPHLRPATQYAYYIKTYTEQANVFSAIKYFRTTSARPSLPINVSVSALEGGDLLVSWEPPLRPNGVLSHYIVIGELREDREEEEQLAAWDYCVDPPAPTPGPGPGPASKPGKLAMAPQQGCCCGGCCHVLLDEDQCQRVIQSHHDQDARSLVLDACGSPVTSMDRCTHLFHTIVAENSMTASSHFPFKKSEDQRGEIDLKESWMDSRVLKRFVRTLAPSFQSTRVSSLRSFGLYFIKVHACGQEDEEQNPSPLDALCSAPAVSAARTRPRVQADTVECAVVSVDSMAILVNWTEPPSSNGLILSYEIRYRKEAEQLELCVSRQSFRRDMGARISVQPGVYEVSVRAKSLGGSGPWCAAGTVEVPVPVPVPVPTPSHQVLTVVVALFLALALLCAGLYVLRRRYKRHRQAADTRNLMDPTEWWDLPADEFWPPRAVEIDEPIVTFTKQENEDGDVLFQRPVSRHHSPEVPQNSATSFSSSSTFERRGQFSVGGNPFRHKARCESPFDESPSVSTNPFLSKACGVFEEEYFSQASVLKNDHHVDPGDFLSKLFVKYGKTSEEGTVIESNPILTGDQKLFIGSSFNIPR